jgi:hypothetical protein
MNNQVCFFMYSIFLGKGPDRKKYEDQIKRLKLRRVALRTMWLASEDYPLLLGMPADFMCACTLVGVAQNFPQLDGFLSMKFVFFKYMHYRVS